jgi:hypothetical protein
MSSTIQVLVRGMTKMNRGKSGVVTVTDSVVVELVDRQSFQDTFINDI